MMIFKSVRAKILYKMVIIYSLLTLIPLIVVGATFYLRSKEVLRERSTQNQSVYEIMSDIRANVDRILREAEGSMNELAGASAVQYLLRNDQWPDRYPLNFKNRALLEETVKEMLAAQTGYSIAHNLHYIDSVLLFSRSGNVYKGNEAHQIEHYEALDIMPYKREGTPEWAFFSDNKRMVASVKIYDGRDGEDIGMLVFVLNTEAIREMFARFPSNGYVYVINDSNLILAAQNEASVGRLYTLYDREKWIEHSMQSAVADYRYVGVINIEGLYKRIDRQAVITALITLMAWIAVVLITYVIVKRMLNPLLRLNKVMKQAERENYEQVTDIRSSDEIAMLCLNYNKLIANMQHLIESVYKSELNHKEAELKAIRMHFNPHFLYNTLEYVSILSRTPSQEVQIPALIQDLSQILRFSISSPEPFVPLELEIYFCKLYLSIHSRRYEERFRYTIEIPEELLSVLVPKLILQPLIENAFVHGIDHLESGGFIDIYAYEENYDLIIEMVNSGPEYDPVEESSNIPAGTGTALANVRSRIQLHYGDRYGLTLHKTDGGGMRVRLCLPILFAAESQEDEQ